MAFRFVKTGLILVGILFGLMGSSCNLSDSTPTSPGNTNGGNNIPKGGSSSNDLLFEAVIVQEDTDVHAWVRLCDAQRQTISDANVTINGRTYNYIEPRHMLFFEATCAHYEATPAYKAGKTYSLRIKTRDNKIARGQVIAPKTQSFFIRSVVPSVTIPRNQDLPLTWSFEGATPEVILIAILDQTGRRLYAGLTSGDATQFVIPAADMLNIPPGQHDIWLMGLNGIQINTKLTDPVLGVGSGLWVGVARRVTAFFI